ncbi:hypothetical protein GE061_016248 [Apolygus lucorum]|uniref:ATP-dependent DNA helicase PIF1 n=1 Tax=Apolygus lucorum TaxID=248454 RepID=A0A6A4K3Z7_APOLU|nr:hypothetical protein GE061_016248 [Apolygus lucorum]
MTSVQDYSSISCCCNLEWLSSTGVVKRTVRTKTGQLSVVRNEFRDLFIALASRETNQKFSLKGVVIHKKFANEGKATLKFPDLLLNLFISNAAPAQLIMFLKALFVKMTSSKASPKVSTRDKLLSVKQQGVQEISPLSSKDAQRVNAMLKSEGSKKRPREEENTVSSGPEKKVCLKSLANLTEEQKEVLDAVKNGANVFFTGSAGTGKSFLLQHLINCLRPDVTCATASTGSAACLIGGTTLHSFAGIGDGEGTIERCIQLARRPVCIQNWRRCKHLIIDEISMVESSYFQKLERVARELRSFDKPFGGIQLIVCGDFLQLPPVSKSKDKFCFMSDAWQSCRFRTYYLQQVHRQNDPTFISILNSVRLGNLKEDMVEALKNTETQIIEKKGVLATRLCCHTKEAKMINDSNLEKLTGESKTYSAVDEPPNASKTLDDCTPVESSLTLKIGAQVMLLKNVSVSQGLVNGARGVIAKFEKGAPVVEFLCGATYTVKWEKWTTRTANGGMMHRKQLPLRLAWAFSIHKSQGLTLDCVEMALEKTFEAGQAYVALSRAKSLETMRVIGFNAKQVWADPDVIQFYRGILSEVSMNDHMKPRAVTKSKPGAKKLVNKFKHIPLVSIS